MEINKQCQIKRDFYGENMSRKYDENKWKIITNNIKKNHGKNVKKMGGLELHNGVQSEVSCAWPKASQSIWS